MRTLLATLTALMLFATAVVAGDFEDAATTYNAGDYQKAFRPWKPLAEQIAEAQKLSSEYWDKYVVPF
jgi:hypothetical protein